MDVRAGGDRLRGEADDLAVLPHRLALGDVASATLCPSPIGSRTSTLIVRQIQRTNPLASAGPRPPRCHRLEAEPPGAARSLLTSRGLRFRRRTGLVLSLQHTLAGPRG